MSYIDTLWVRHCNTCSNEAIDPIDKFEVPTLCTALGLRQALVLASHIKNLARSKKIELQNIEFYCSYLPRAMMTAGLAAGLLGAELNDKKIIQVLCHIGEFENAYEKDNFRQQEVSQRGCVQAASESVTTKVNTKCWIKSINLFLKLADLQAKLKMGDITCSPRSTPCADNTTQAWMADWKGRDYEMVEADFIRPLILSSQQQISPKLYVIVSHGSFIRASLYSQTSLPPPNAHMENTAMVYQKYTLQSGNQDGDKIVRDAPIEYTLQVLNYPLTPDEKKNINNALKSIMGSISTWSNLQMTEEEWNSYMCNWKESSSFPWSRCLSNTRREILHRTHNDD